MGEPRSLDTRQKILEVAETRFAQKGFAGAPLEEIAREVGVRKTALYYYFASKAALYAAVLERMLAAFDQAIGAATENELPPAEGLERLLDAVNDVLAEHPNYSQILIRIFVDRVEFDASSLEPMIARIVGRVMRLHRAGVDAGAFRKGSARHFFQTLLGATVFHYAARDFSAAVLGVDDIFTRANVAWRRREVHRLLVRAVLVDADES